MTVPATGAGAARRRGAWVALAYLVPALVVFGVFVFWPLVKSVLLSVQGTDILGNPSGYVGFVNYSKLFSDPDFLTVLWVTFAFTVLTVLPSIAIADKAPPNVGDVTKAEMTSRPVSRAAAANSSRAGFTTLSISGRS